MPVEVTEERPQGVPGARRGAEDSPAAAVGDGACSRITVIVPTRDRGAMLGDCLRSLLALDYPAYEIVIVDQSATDLTARTVHAVAGHDGRVRLHAVRPSGVSAARNAGALVSDSEVVAYTDDDCVVDPGWLRALAGEFDDPRVAAVYGRVLPIGDERRTGTEVAYQPTLGRRAYTARTPPWYIGHGANMAFRRAVLLEAGGFDPLLGAGGVFPAAGDIDLAYRLVSANRCVVYSSAALVRHAQWRAWPERRRTEIRYAIGAGAVFAKHVRLGDRYGLRLLATWLWELGVRRIGAGLLKWRSLRPVTLGCCQLVFTWVGIARALRWPIDRQRRVYRERGPD